MATFPGLDLLSNFSFIFTFLFAFALILGFLLKTKPFGEDKKNLYSIMAFSLSCILLFSKRVVNIMTFSAPWFIILIIFVFFIIFILMIFGVDVGSISDFIKGSGGGTQGKTVIYWILAFAILIFIFAVSQEFGQSAGPYLGEESNTTTTTINSSLSASGSGETNTDNFETNLGATLFHPKVLGMFCVILIGTFTVMQLSRNN